MVLPFTGLVKLRADAVSRYGRHGGTEFLIEVRYLPHGHGGFIHGMARVIHRHKGHLSLLRKNRCL